MPLCVACPKKTVERETGFEPATSTLARLHSTTELLPHRCWRRHPDLNRRMEVLQTSALPLGYAASSVSLERETGFEPATSTLARLHSTTELLPLNEESLLRHSPAPCQAGFSQNIDRFPQDVAWCGFAARESAAARVRVRFRSVRRQAEGGMRTPPGRPFGAPPESDRRSRRMFRSFPSFRAIRGL